MKTFCLTALGLLTLTALGFAADIPAPAVTELDRITVLVPGGTSGKLPVVFLAHNGNESRKDWGDYPVELARKGYVVVNVGWSRFDGCDDFETGIKTALARFGDRIDPARTAFIGGCHGGVKMVSALHDTLPVTVKAIALLSLSEKYTPPEVHAPVLGIYSTNDHLGDGYVRVQKAVLEDLLNGPKTVVSLPGTQHGDEMVTDPATKDQVRARVNAWLAEHL